MPGSHFTINSQGFYVASIKWKNSVGCFEAWKDNDTIQNLIRAIILVKVNQFTENMVQKMEIEALYMLEAKVEC